MKLDAVSTGAMSFTQCPRAHSVSGSSGPGDFLSLAAGQTLGGRAPRDVTPGPAVTEFARAGGSQAETVTKQGLAKEAPRNSRAARHRYDLPVTGRRRGRRPSSGWRRWRCLPVWSYKWGVLSKLRSASPLTQLRSVRLGFAVGRPSPRWQCRHGTVTVTARLTTRSRMPVVMALQLEVASATALGRTRRNRSAATSEVRVEFAQANDWSLTVPIELMPAKPWRVFIG